MYGRGYQGPGMRLGPPVTPPIVKQLLIANAAVFVLQFGGPQAQGCSEGAQGAAAQVYGDAISRTELHSAMVLTTGV